MIDTINIHLPSEIVPANYLKNHSSLFWAASKTIKEDGQLSVQARFKNFLLRQNESGIYIYGSLTKFYNGTNQKTLLIGEIPKAIKLLSDQLRLPIIEGRVNRIDIAENLVTKEKVKNYFKVLGEARYFQRLEQNHGLSYQNVNRGVLFYDKKKEVQRRKEVLTKIFGQHNVLRLEYRFLNHKALADYLNLQTVTVKDVIENYQRLVDAWGDVFLTINQKHDILTVNPEAFREKSGFDKQIKIMGVEALGGLPAVIRIVKEARKEKLFKYPNEATNLIQKFTALMKTPKLTEKSKLAEELERKVKIASFVNSNREYLWT